MQNSRKPSRQGGAVLLAMMLILIAGSSYALVSRLNRHVNEYMRNSSTQAALQKAKQGLLSYAMNYPDLRDNPQKGPGFLPCPDGNNDGSPESGCAVTSGTTLGRLPFRILGLADLSDSSGERLWYAVSDNFKNTQPDTTVVNSDTPGLLSVDTTGDIVAVIIAPGEPTTEIDPIKCTLPFTAQTGRPGNSAIDYLDFDNNSMADNFFITKHANKDCPFNDRVVYITRQELMQAIEKRVLSDMAKVLGDYQDTHGGYPWLSPFTDPSASEFRGVAGTYQGHIPFHWTGSPAFTTDVSLTWSISNSVITNSPWGWIYQVQTPDLECVTSSACTDENYPDLSNGAPLPLTDADCVWVNKEVFKCTATYVVDTIITHAQQPLTGWVFGIGDYQWIFKQPESYWVRGRGECIWPCLTQTQYAYSENVTRTYSIDITFLDNTADGIEVSGPSASTVRIRDLTLEDNGSSLVSTGTNDVTIIITDVRKIVVDEPGPGPDPEYTITTSRTLNNGINTTGTITATGVQYDLDGLNGGYDTNADGDFEDPGDAPPTEPELPSWFVKNHWQDMIYAAYPSAETLPGDDDPAAACVEGTNCLTLNGVPPINNNKRAIVMAAGSVLPTNLSRPNASRNAYFEGENAEPANEIFEKTAQSATSNDQIRVLATSP